MQLVSFELDVDLEIWCGSRCGDWYLCFVGQVYAEETVRNLGTGVDVTGVSDSTTFLDDVSDILADGTQFASDVTNCLWWIKVDSASILERTQRRGVGVFLRNTTSLEYWGGLTIDYYDMTINDRSPFFFVARFFHFVCTFTVNTPFFITTDQFIF